MLAPKPNGFCCCREARNEFSSFWEIDPSLLVSIAAKRFGELLLVLELKGAPAPLREWREGFFDLLFFFLLVEEKAEMMIGPPCSFICSCSLFTRGRLKTFSFSLPPPPVLDQIRKNKPKKEDGPFSAALCFQIPPPPSPLSISKVLRGGGRRPETQDGP